MTGDRADNGIVAVMRRPTEQTQQLLQRAAHALALGRARTAREALRSVGGDCGLNDPRAWPDEREVEALAASMALSPGDHAAMQRAWAEDALAAIDFLKPRRAKAEPMPLGPAFGQPPALTLWLHEESAEALLLELSERGLPARLVRRRLHQCSKPGQPPTQIDCLAFLAGERPVTLVALPASMRSDRYSWQASEQPIDLLSAASIKQLLTSPDSPKTASED